MSAIDTLSSAPPVHMRHAPPRASLFNEDGGAQAQDAVDASAAGGPSAPAQSSLPITPLRTPLLSIDSFLAVSGDGVTGPAPAEDGADAGGAGGGVSPYDAVMTVALRDAKPRGLDLDQPLRSVMFKAADANGDGTLTREELRAQVQAGGGREADADAWYDALDPDGTGSVDREQYTTHMATASLDGSGRESSFMDVLRSTLDPDGDGKANDDLVDELLARAGASAEDQAALRETLLA